MIFKRSAIIAATLIGFGAHSQNETDAIRYSQTGVGGSSRFVAMGGAFGALGADMSVSSFNPAGLGLYRKGDIAFGGGFMVRNSESSVYGKSASLTGANVKFDNFGLATAFNSKQDPDSRHVIAFTINQLQNFNSSMSYNGYTNSSSIAKDMLILAETYKSGQPDITRNLYSTYEGMGFNTYLLDTANGHFYSYLDTRRSVYQSREIQTTGRMNDINFSYAYSYKDKFYFGASIGIPQINYTHSLKHIESDLRDSMRIVITPNDTFNTYIDEPPFFYTDKLGFNDLTYNEYFKTTGSGINLKLGGILRVNDAFRIGLHYHTPTFYNLQDVYSYSMTTTFDYDPGYVYSITEPDGGGIFKYRVITPSRTGLSLGFVLDKLALIGLDYEFVNYKRAQLGSGNTSDFSDANSAIKSNYSGGHNIRLGGEINAKPFMFRLGYNMMGSPYGDVFSGSMVRNTFSGGVGFRSESGFYVDVVLAYNTGNYNYSPFTALNTVVKVKQTTTTFGITAGIKF